MRWSEGARVGIVILLAGGVLAGIWRGIQGFGTPDRVLYVAFTDAQGVRQRADVRLRGVSVGEVERVEFREGRPVLRLRLAPITLPERVAFRIVSPLIGFSSPHIEIVEVKSGGQLVPPTGTMSANQAPLRGDTPGTTTEDLAPRAEELVNNLNRLTLQLGDLAGHMTRVAGDQRLQRNLLAITENFAVASKNLAAFSRSTPAIAKNLEGGSASVPIIAKNLEGGSKQLAELASSFQKTAGRLDATLAQTDRLMAEFQSTATEFRGAATQLNRAAEENRPKLGGLLDGLQVSLKTLNTTLENAQNLVGDPQLKSSFLQTAENVRVATDNLKLLGSDVRTLTSDPKVQGDIREAIAALRATMGEALTAFQQMNRLLEGSGDTIDRVRGSLRSTAINTQIGFAPRPKRVRVGADATVPWTNGTFARLGATDIGEANRLNLQAGFPVRYGDWEVRNTWARFGLHKSHLGLGADVGSPERPQFSFDLYGTRTPKVDMQGSFRLNSYLDAVLGLGNAFHNPQPILGLRYHYQYERTER